MDGNFFNGYLTTIPVRYHIARLEADPHQRRRLKGISAGFLGSGKADIHAPAIESMNPPKTERRFRSGNPPLSRRRLLHVANGINLKRGGV